MPAAGEIIDIVDYPDATGPIIRSTDAGGGVAGQTIVATED